MDNDATVNSANQRTEYADQRDADAFWAAARPADEPMRHRWFLPAIFLILGVSVPWYLPTEIADRVLGGLPLWTWITLIATVALATLTAVAALKFWRNHPTGIGDDAGRTMADVRGE